MSRLAPFVDAATSIDPVNFPNTYVSYYPWGEVVALGLDLTLRQRFREPLDGFMRLMWQRYGRPACPTGWRISQALADYSGDSTFAREFFAQYIRGSAMQDYATLLAPAGLLLRPARPDSASLGRMQFEYDSSGALLATGSLIGSPLYQAGLDREDVIRTLDGRRLTSDSTWTRCLPPIIRATRSR